MPTPRNRLNVESAIQQIDDYTDSRYRRFYLLIWRGTTMTEPFAQNMDDFAAFRDDRSQEKILAAADVLCDAGNLAPIQEALASSMTNLLQFGHVERGSQYLTGTSKSTGIDEESLEIYIECFAVRAFDVIRWLLTLNQIQVADFRNAEINRLCRIFVSRLTPLNQRKEASADLENFVDLLRNGIRWNPVSPRNERKVLDDEIEKQLEKSVRLTLEEVATLCQRAKSTVYEQHKSGLAGWEDPREPGALYWYRAWLRANAREDVEEFLRNLKKR